MKVRPFFQEWADKKLRERRIYHKWFAWYPVRTQVEIGPDNWEWQLRWCEWLMRKEIGTNFPGIGEICYVWHYERPLVR